MTKPPNPPVNTTASWRVELHLHFLIFYFLRNRTNKNKNMDSFEDREKQRLTWLLIFNFPLVFFFVLFFFVCFFDVVVIFFDCLHSGGRKEKPSQPISLPGLKKQPICCWVFELWIQYYLMFHMWKLIKCWSESKLEGEPSRKNRHAHCTDVPTHTNTYTQHTHRYTIHSKRALSAQS